MNGDLDNTSDDIWTRGLESDEERGRVIEESINKNVAVDTMEFRWRMRKKRSSEKVLVDAYITDKTR